MKTFPLVTLSVLALASPAIGQAISINNAGFELPVLADNGYVFGAPSWTSLGTCGVYNPWAAAVPTEAPEGANVGFVSCCFGPNPNSGSLSQALSTNYAADKTYTFTTALAHTHMITVTAAMFTQLKANQNASVTSTSDGTHTHLVVISCL